MDSSAKDSRLSRQTGSTRRSRLAEDRSTTENRVRTDADRLAEFRNSHAAAFLPRLPDIEGYHCCWLTTNNPRDSLQYRERLGYVPIRADEVADTGTFDNCVGKQGTPMDGLIHVNEMVAYKIPRHLYDAYMREAHHTAPRAEEQKITERAEELAHDLERMGSRVGEGSGIDALRNLDSVPEPDFSDD